MLGAVALLVAGIVSINNIPLDAIPDLSDTQVIIRTDWRTSTHKWLRIKSPSHYQHKCWVYPKQKSCAGFPCSAPPLFTLFLMMARICTGRAAAFWNPCHKSTGELPEGARPELGPDATGVGWVFQYAVFDRTGQHDLAELRSLQDWFIRYELATIDGVAEVASVGGFVKEYQVLVDPNKLRAFDISLPMVIEAVRGANQETGGRTLEMAESEYLIRSFGYVDKPEI